MREGERGKEQVEEREEVGVEWSAGARDGGGVYIRKMRERWSERKEVGHMSRVGPEVNNFTRHWICMALKNVMSGLRCDATFGAVLSS